MWFRRKNKPDSDHSVLSSTLVSLQGLLDERPIEARPGNRQEPRLPPAPASSANGAPSALSSAAEIDDTAEIVMASSEDKTTDGNEETSGAETSEPAAESATSKPSGSSWADLDLDFDEVATTGVMPAVKDTTVTEEKEPEPDAEPGPAAQTAGTSVIDDEEETATVAADTGEPDAGTPSPEDTLQLEPDQASGEDDTQSTLFDVIPTLNEIVFDPESGSDQVAAQAEPADVLEPEPVVADQFPEPGPEPGTGLDPVEPEPSTEEPEQPAVIVAGVTSAPPPEPQQPVAVAEHGSVPETVPLAPSDFTEHLMQRLRLEYAQRTGADLPVPFANAAHGILQDALQQWITQARRVLQRK